jgi:CheY-like chemotaxis protein
MGLACLLVTRDAEVVRRLRRVLQDFQVELMVSGEPEEAATLLRRRTFDGLILDCDNRPENTALLESLRQGKSNRCAIVFAILDGATSSRRAFELGANFVLEKPLALDRTIRSFRAAYGLMVRESRRYFRCDVDMPVTLEFSDKPPQSCMLLNVSEGGIALRGHGRLSRGAGVKVSFTLPDMRTHIVAKGEVAWSTEDGRSGIRFLLLSEATRQALVSFLAVAMDSDKPRAATLQRRPAAADNLRLVAGTALHK